MSLTSLLARQGPLGLDQLDATVNARQWDESATGEHPRLGAGRLMGAAFLEPVLQPPSLIRGQILQALADERSSKALVVLAFLCKTTQNRRQEPGILDN